LYFWKEHFFEVGLSVGVLGPFVRSDTETDFPRPVRSVKKSCLGGLVER